MWILFAMLLLIATADQLPDDDLHEMELSTFYADCSVYEDPALFGGPVCGSDGNTYHNCVHFACLNHWREPSEKCKIVYKGPCDEIVVPWDWNPVYDPVCGTDNLTYCNLQALILKAQTTGTEISVQYPGECVNPEANCLGVDAGNWAHAVCASNGRTYPSVQAILDMRKFGQCLDVLHDGGCTVDEVKERIRGRAEVCDLARNYYELNPVCGEDNVTYANPYILLCYRPNVKASYMGECDSTLHNACQHAVNIDTGKEEASGPVCGSDGLTYTSKHHLKCATNNDKFLYKLHKGPCTAADNPCNNMPEVTDEGSPVCGSDGVTYINSYALWCMQRREDPFLRFFHEGACLRRCLECCSCSYACAGGAIGGGGGGDSCPASSSYVN